MSLEMRETFFQDLSRNILDLTGSDAQKGITASIIFLDKS